MFAFVNRVASPFWDRVRGLIETWFGSLDPETRDDLRGRLRSDDDRQCRAAFWELYCHETLLRLGFEVTSHPDGLGERGRPDFLAERDDVRFVLEATMAGDADAEVSVARLENNIFDAINRVDLPNFTPCATVKGHGKVQPSLSRLRRELGGWLQSLDVDQVRAIGLSEPWMWEDRGWRVEFMACPRSPALLGKPGIRALLSFEPTWGSHDEARPIRGAIVNKANAYGALGLPFVVAVATRPWRDAPSDVDVTRGLFGEISRVGPKRDRDGAWSGPSGTRNTRVSGVLVAGHADPWRVGELVPSLWHHPDAKHPIVLSETPWRQVAVDPSTGAVSSEVPRSSPSSFFDLDDGWPGPEPPFPR